MASTGLAQSSVWNGKIYSGGWRSAEGGAPADSRFEVSFETAK